MEKIYDVVIIGSGPAGLAAAIYAARARLEAIVIERLPVSGGQIINTYDVDNYPGLPGISGFDLGTKMRSHAEAMGAEFLEAEVTAIQVEGTSKKIILEDRELNTRTIIAATGARHRLLGVDGEERLTGMGVSYCATCDGAFFRNKTTVVVGGGDVAVEDAIFLSRICSKVYLIHRRDELRAAKILQDHLMELDNVEIIWNSVVSKICGQDDVEEVIVENVKTNVTTELQTDGVFIAVGIVPNSSLFEGLVSLDEGGYIQSGEDCRTSLPGVYATGDVRSKSFRQVITAASDGANAIASIQSDLLQGM